jgi:hypothetical protein
VPESWQHINSLTIKRISFLRENPFMKYLVLPVICLLTLGTFPLFLYWYTNFYVYCLFDIVSIGSFEEMVKKVKTQKKLIAEELEK